MPASSTPGLYPPGTGSNHPRLLPLPNVPWGTPSALGRLQQTEPTPAITVRAPKPEHALGLSFCYRLPPHSPPKAQSHRRRRAPTSAPVYTPLKFLYNSKPHTIPHTASLPETSCLPVFPSRLGPQRRHRGVQERARKDPNRKGSFKGLDKQRLRGPPPPHAPAPSPGSPPSETCTCCSFRPEGPFSHSPSVKPYRPPRQREPRRSHRPLLGCPRALNYLITTPLIVTVRRGLCVPSRRRHRTSRQVPGTRSAGQWGRESPTTLLGPEPGPGRPRAGRGCPRGGGRGRNGGDVPGRWGCVRARKGGQEESQERLAAAGRLRNWGRGAGGRGLSGGPRGPSGGRSPAWRGGGSSHSGLIRAPPPPRRWRLRPLLRGPV